MNGMMGSFKDGTFVPHPNAKQLEYEVAFESIEKEDDEQKPDWYYYPMTIRKRYPVALARQAARNKAKAQAPAPKCECPCHTLPERFSPRIREILVKHIHKLTDRGLWKYTASILPCKRHRDEMEADSAAGPSVVDNSEIALPDMSSLSLQEAPALMPEGDSEVTDEGFVMVEAPL